VQGDHGIEPPRTRGSIRVDGRELLGKPPYWICGSGIAYVPQGRRLFPSLSTHEHPRMIGGPLRKRGRWTIDAVYEPFPRLAERRGISGAMLPLPGGEQQMLGIGRAMLTNPRRS
jgi:branched-chain amino acid transport system ATP-binding protein